LLRVNSPGVSALGIPALDASSKEAGFFDIFLEDPLRAFDGSSPATKAEKELAKKQKAWLCSNFRIEINGHSSRVNKVEAIVIKQIAADLDGDSFPDLIAPDITLTLDLADAGPYRQWFEGVQAGLPSTRHMSLILTDNNGQKLFTLGMEVYPAALGFENLFDELNPASDSQVQVTLRHKELTGHVTLIK